MKKYSESFSYPKITIITPSFNQGFYLERTIKSVLDQDYPELEYIIIDGKSSDQSLSIIKKYKPFLANWESEIDSGPANALNKGFSSSSGEIMGWLNADDVYLHNTLKTVGQIFRDYPHIDWITSGSIHLSEDDKFFMLSSSRKWFTRWSQIFLRSIPPQQCTFWRRSLWERAGAYLDETTRFMDCELWLRFYRHSSLYIVDSVFGAWRLYSGAYSIKNIDSFYAQIDETHKSFLKNYLKIHPFMNIMLPFLHFYYKIIDRKLLNRLFFELFIRRNRLLSYDLKSQRFRIGKTKGILPKPWPRQFFD